MIRMFHSHREQRMQRLRNNVSLGECTLEQIVVIVENKLDLLRPKGK